MDIDDTNRRLRILEGLFHQTYGYLNRIESTKLGRIGLTSIRMMVLSTLKQASEPVTMAMIAESITRELNTVTELLKRMEKDGLIKKVRQKRGLNLFTIELTENGERAYLKATQIDTVHKILSSLSQEEQGNLVVYLQKIHSKSLEELNELNIFPST